MHSFLLQNDMHSSLTLFQFHGDCISGEDKNWTLILINNKYSLSRAYMMSPLLIDTTSIRYTLSKFWHFSYLHCGSPLMIVLLFKQVLRVLCCLCYYIVSNSIYILLYLYSPQKQNKSLYMNCSDGFNDDSDIPE